MSSVRPGYGETPISYEEAGALLLNVRELLGEPVLKSDVYDLEQSIEGEVREELTDEVLGGQRSLDDLLSDHFVRELHRRLYGDIWQWAGQLRTREISIGIAPEYVAIELRQSLDSLKYRWEHNRDWSARALGIAVHADTVRIHPFADGSGRTTRLLAELVYLATQDTPTPARYSWLVEKVAYIDLLRRYDQNRDPLPLAAFIPVEPL